MPYQLLTRLARKQFPIYISDPHKLKLLRRLLRAGYVEGRLFPETPGATQFAQVDRITPLGERVRTILANAGIPAGPKATSDIGRTR